MVTFPIQMVSFNTKANDVSSFSRQLKLGKLENYDNELSVYK